MDSVYLVLGGAGLVGLQVCRQIANELGASRVVVASLLQSEAEAACVRLAGEFPAVAWVPAWGNLFVPASLADAPRGAILGDVAKRTELLEAVYGDFDAAYRGNTLVQLVLRHRPHVMVDCVNTATGFSYQDVFDGAAKVRERVRDADFGAEGVRDIETFLLSQSVPQLVRHVRFLHQVATDCKVRLYLKVGTTGTGGMGLNIPYTHSEDKPSRKLLAKTETAFGHTGLLFLLARTPGAPIVKEVKPAAMIGYKGVAVADVRNKHDSNVLYEPVTVSLGERLELKDDPGRYTVAGTLRTTVVDTGENGVFTRGEFAAITGLDQMEYVTPEEIARDVVTEIRGGNTGTDIIGALDAAVMSPSYKAGLLRQDAIHELGAVEAEALARGEAVLPSVALGKLGPPELSKLLFEAELLRAACGTIAAVAGEVSAEALAEACAAKLVESGVARAAPSIGVPVLLPDGRLLRGPRLNVPEVLGNEHNIPVGAGDVDTWAKKGWVDLRASNMAVWQERFRKVLGTTSPLRTAGTAAVSRHSFRAASFEIGEVVAWVFNNEMGGYRVK